MEEWPLTTTSNPGDAGLAREAAAELYAGDPAEFIRRRGELAARARASGDATAARAITSLRKPTRAAWVVNRLVRDDPGAAARLAELGAGLQQAGHALDGGRLRELSRQRRELIAALTRQALAGLPDAPGALQEEVAATLSAAVTDPQVAAELAAGALARPVERAGFGFGPPAAEDERVLAGAPQGQPAKRPADNSKKRATGIEAGPAQPSAGAGRAERASHAERARAERERQLAERERQLAERKRQRRAIAEAEQAVRDAEQAADAAQAAERDRAGAVRQREQQLEAAQDDLAAAKRESRAAASALRDARRALGRLQARTPG